MNVDELLWIKFIHFIRVCHFFTFCEGDDGDVSSHRLLANALRATLLFHSSIHLCCRGAGQSHISGSTPPPPPPPLLFVSVYCFVIILIYFSFFIRVIFVCVPSTRKKLNQKKSMPTASLQTKCDSSHHSLLQYLFYSIYNIKVIVKLPLSLLILILLHYYYYYPSNS